MKNGKPVILNNKEGDKRKELTIKLVLVEYSCKLKKRECVKYREG